jgi:hypothetical protein
VVIIHNLKDRIQEARIQEARINQWLGEVQGLQTSLDAASRKLASLDRIRNHPVVDQVGIVKSVVGAADGRPARELATSSPDSSSPSPLQ